MKIREAAIRTSILLVLAAPIVVYVSVFGWNLSDNHSRWGEFGSAMSGVYTPVLALLTLSVLVFQARIQQQLHKHELDQAYIQQARADVEFYVNRLSDLLSLRLPNGSTVREVLHHNFQPEAASQLDSELIRRLAKELDREVPHTLGVLFALQSILAGLSASEEGAYRLNFTSAVQKLTAILGFETCVSLENFHRARTEGRLDIRYLFSPLLRDK